jgi:hypothetical protein
MTAPSNDDDHFIEMPVVAGSRSHLAQVASDRRTEFEKPAPDGFVRDIQASLCKQILHVSIAQSEAGIEPNGMANDVRWKSVALKADFVHLDRLPQMPVRVRNVNVTMPRRNLLEAKGKVHKLPKTIGRSSFAI